MAKEAERWSSDSSDPVTLINEVGLILSGYHYIIVDVMVDTVADVTYLRVCVILVAVCLTQVSHLHEQMRSRILKKDDNKIMQIASCTVSS